MGDCLKMKMKFWEDDRVRWTVGQKDLIFDASISRVGAEITSNGVNIFATIEMDKEQETP